MTKLLLTLLPLALFAIVAASPNHTASQQLRPSPASSTLALVNGPQPRLLTPPRQPTQYMIQATDPITNPIDLNPLAKSGLGLAKAFIDDNARAFYTIGFLMAVAGLAFGYFSKGAAALKWAGLGVVAVYWLSVILIQHIDQLVDIADNAK